MPGILSWKLEISGLDQSIAKLRELSRLIQTITSNSSKLGQIGNSLQNATARGGGFRPVIISRGGVLEGAAGGAIAGRVMRPHVHPDAGNRIGHPDAGKVVNLGGQDISSTLRGIQIQKEQAILAYQNLRKNILGGTSSDPAKPFDRKSAIGTAADMRRFIKDKTTEEQKLTAPFIGNRFTHAFRMAGMDDKTGKYKEGGIDNIMKSFSPGKGGKLGGLISGTVNGGVSEAGSAIAGFIQPLSLLKVGLAAATTGILLLHKALKIMSETVAEGASAFHTGARIAHSVSVSQQMEFAAKAVGIDPQSLENMALKAQFGKQGKVKISSLNSDPNILLGAAKSGEFGNMQQMLNQSKEFEQAWKDAAVNAFEVENSSKALAETQVSMLSVTREWKTLWQQIATIFSPIIKVISSAIEAILAELNRQLFLIVKTMQFLHLVPKGGPGTDKYPGSSGKTLAGTATSWEKLGFVFGASKKDHLADISANTRKTAESLMKMVEQETRGSGKFNNNTPITSMP